jgi:hypothetical protein
MDWTLPTLQVEADLCAASVELQDLTRALIRVLREDPDWRRSKLLRTVWRQYMIEMLQHSPHLLTIPFDEMARRPQMELQQIQSPHQEEDDGDDHSVEHIDIASTDRNDAMFDIDPRLSDSEFQEVLQYQRLLDGDSSEHACAGQARETTDFPSPTEESRKVLEIGRGDLSD